MKMISKRKTTSKMKTIRKMKTTLKTKTTLNLIYLPPHLREYYLKFFLMTSHLNSHRTTDIKPEMLSGVQTGNGTPHDKYDIRGIAHAWTNRKDYICKQRRQGQIFTCILEWGQRTYKKSRPYPARAYTTLVVLVVKQLVTRIRLRICRIFTRRTD